MLFKIEGEHEHLGPASVDRPRKGHHVDILDIVDMAAIVAVGQTVKELQLGSQLKKLQIEIATGTNLQVEVLFLQLKEVVTVIAEINHRVEPCHEIRSVIAIARTREDEVESCRHIDRLQVLILLRGIALTVTMREVTKGDMPVAEVDGRGYAELEILGQTGLTQHTHIESRVPAILVGRHYGLVGCSVVRRHRLRADIPHLNILKVSTNEDTEMERTQVGVGAVLHRAANLAQRAAGHPEQEEQCQ